MSESAKTAQTSTNPEESFRFGIGPYIFSVIVFGGLYTFWARIRTLGTENIPASGGMIAVSNHQSMIDPFAIAWVFRRNIRYMGKTELFKHKLVAWFLSWYGAFPVDRTRRDPQALRTALNILRAKQVLGMFPEGTRSEHGELQEFHTGAIRLAIKTQVPIIPCGIAGSYRVLPRGANWPRPHPIGIAVGQPITYEHLYDHHPSPAEVQAAAEALEQRIAALIKEAEQFWRK